MLLISHSDISDTGDAARLRAVERYRAADGTSNQVFARMATLAASIMGAPMAAVSIVDRERNWFLGVHGLEAVSDVPRLDGLCGSVIAGDIPRMVSDTLGDAGAKANRFVQRHGVRFYACAPIVDSAGHALGDVAVMDTEARFPTEDRLRMLDQIAVIVAEQLELRLAASDAMRAERRMLDAAEFARKDARADQQIAERARDAARRDRDDARSDRREAERGRRDAWLDRDSALRDRDLAERERDVIEQYASVLQRTLLPPLLPVIEGLALAAHYHPASSRPVGGDFYDVFALDDHRCAFFVGDVEGHGVNAAVATSLIRYTLRSAALHCPDPRDALTELNDVLLRELDARRFCTVLLGIVNRAHDGDGFQLQLATGGHQPALLLDPASRSAHPVRSTGGMFVGAVPDAAFESCSLRLRPGQTLLCYTDGIIEARRGANSFAQVAAGSVRRRTLRIGRRRPRQGVGDLNPEAGSRRRRSRARHDRTLTPWAGPPDR